MFVKEKWEKTKLEFSSTIGPENRKFRLNTHTHMLAFGRVYMFVCVGHICNVCVCMCACLFAYD